MLFKFVVMSTNCYKKFVSSFSLNLNCIQVALTNCYLITECNYANIYQQVFLINKRQREIHIFKYAVQSSSTTNDFKFVFSWSCICSWTICIYNGALSVLCDQSTEVHFDRCLYHEVNVKGVKCFWWFCFTLANLLSNCTLNKFLAKTWNVSSNSKNWET